MRHILVLKRLCKDPFGVLCGSAEWLHSGHVGTRSHAFPLFIVVDYGRLCWVLMDLRNSELLPVAQLVKRPRLDPWVGKIPLEKEMAIHPSILGGKPQGQNSLAGYSPWGRKELDMIQLRFKPPLGEFRISLGI